MFGLMIDMLSWNNVHIIMLKNEIKSEKLCIICEVQIKIANGNNNGINTQHSTKG